jgi:hypothetical protein
VTIDKEERRAIHSQAVAFLTVRVCGGFKPMSIEIARKPNRVQVELTSFCD